MKSYFLVINFYSTFWVKSLFLTNIYKEITKQSIALIYYICLMKIHIIIFCFLFLPFVSKAENGYDLWLRYTKIEDASLLKQCLKTFKNTTVLGESETSGVMKEELALALGKLTGQPFYPHAKPSTNSSLIGRYDLLPAQTAGITKAEVEALGNEGFLIKSNIKGSKNPLIITAKTDVGAMYGMFHLLRLIQTGSSITSLNIASSPKLNIRMLNHWDNLNRSVERGYAGQSIWNWHTLPGYIDQKYIDYARANASLGINGTALTNVNANATVLTKPYLEKVAALADVMRPYGIKVYLTARFSAPIEIGRLKTADPTDPEVLKWWADKANEIYKLIPDFGGFLVKANSEGQPGPQNYNKDHADGANMLAKAVAPHGGIVMWRAFVYSAENADDRHKQAYSEFLPLDPRFDKNVLVQVKNGPIDFMPREPFHPMFGAMQKTPVMMEFQITQEYLGQGTNLAYLAPMYEEVLKADTYAKGKGSTVGKTLDGSLFNHAHSGIAGVSNIGSDINWCGYQFGQANWYAYGRLAWDYNLSSEEIAKEWISMTFSKEVVKPILSIMMPSREGVVNYMDPLGLHHIMATGHHYGPGPWVKELNRPEWNPTYYHKADSLGVGFNRTASGSNALAQYYPQAAAAWTNVNTIDEKFLLWFHHVSWDHKMKNGRSLWDELCYKYQEGISHVENMQKTWASLSGKIDKQRHREISEHLGVQLKDAWWWRNACLLYFQTHSKKPLPQGLPPLDGNLDEYKRIRLNFAPGNG
jgi:alpha-glucuronidase